ncbi:type III secretion protein F [Variovorax sp. OK605]|jgi:type III secretion protein F|uniref:EscF/YscF/HrpA family type III secretion system needle major subunit n=1 Tax=unclassified Variovorax TaxID=663243 RepID=UPI0008B0BD0B|nr:MULTISPECIES: EscF/YscF/HrpA family type III secretion system needle major subunit [unclassified Variovorax]SEK10174.1 type III secretion system major needle protein, YscF/MxiH/PrgI family [Variovorax sp. OK202]SFD66766.1 type III secretion system major needle protein, YscF/MxiH/PrgI family [Variovorax sp. OK212]SFQ12104.1 type III secretion protein F [Variovorax sp. OK605]
MAISSVGNSVTFQSINNSVANVTQRAEANLQTRIAAMGDNPTTSDLLGLQQEVQQWNMFTQIQSTLVKEVADAMKGVIQKAA